MENNQSLDLFDDVLDIKDVFKESASDKEAKLKEKEVIVDPHAKITLDPMEGLEYDDPNKAKVIDEDEQEEVDETEEVETTDEEKALVQQVVDLKAMGALFLPDDYEIESLEKAVQDSEALRNQVATKTVFNQIPDVEVPGIGNAKDLFLYLFEHGGTDIDKFKNNFGAGQFDPKSFDLAKEEDRRAILETYYTKKGFNDVKVKKMVDKVFEDMDDDTEAAEALGELTTMDAQAKQAHLKELAVTKANKEREASEAYTQMAQILEKQDAVGGYPLAKDEKPRAINSLYRQVNIGGEVMSEFDHRLNNVVLTNPSLTLALSAFLNTIVEDPKTKNLSFDLSKFTRAEKTKVVKNLQEITSRVAAGKKKFVSTSEDNSSKKGFNWNNVVSYEDLT